MLAYGVVFVLLLGEIDLSISYVGRDRRRRGCRAPDARQRARASRAARDRLIAVAICGMIGAFQGSIVALRRRALVRRHARRLPDLAGRDPAAARERPGSIIIQDRWINYTASYCFSTSAGWIIAAVDHRPLRARDARGAWPAGGAPASRSGIPGSIVAKMVGIGVAAFGTVAICNHANVPGGLPLAGVIIVVFLVVLDVPGQANDVRPPRLRRRRQRRGRAPRRHQRPADPRSSSS